MAQTIEELSHDVDGIKKVIAAIQRVAVSQEEVNKAHQNGLEATSETLTPLLTSIRELGEHVHNMQIDIQEIKTKLGMK